MLVNIAAVTCTDDKTHHKTITPVLQEEFRIMTSTGATAMVFLNQEKAQLWMVEQRQKFGATAPTMRLVRRSIIQFDEEIGCV